MMDESTMRENSNNEQNIQESNSKPDKTSQRILAVGATLSMVLLSLGVVVWSLGNLRLSIKLKK